jgi:hypothetical protein
VPAPEPVAQTAPPSPRMEVPRYQVPVGVAAPSREEAHVDSSRAAATAKFDENDLDVPAFLRRRGE